MTDWTTTLAGLGDRAWRHLEAGAAEPDHPFRTPCLATTGLGGGAEARMVVLRGAEERASRLEIHTDRASRKVDEIASTPLATLLFWAPRDLLQVRARCRVEVLVGDAVQAAWDAIPDNARRNYGGRPPPSTPMARDTDYAETSERDRFAVLAAEVTSLDILHLGATHRRALFEAGDAPGRWLAP